MPCTDSYEAAPKGAHGRHGATAQIMWLTGPLVESPLWEEQAPHARITLLVFMPRADRGTRTPLFATAAVMQIAAVLLLALPELTTGVAIAYIVLSGACGGFGQQQHFQLWSAEAFPTLRASRASPGR